MFVLKFSSDQLKLLDASLCSAWHVFQKVSSWRGWCGSAAPTPSITSPQFI